MQPTVDFTRFAATKLRDHHAQIRRCVGLLRPEQVWQRHNAHCNSIGNLVLHLTGNVRQWILAAIAGQPFSRDRAAEFNERRPLPPAQVLDELTATVEQACCVIQELTADRLAQPCNIQGYDVSVLTAVFHVVEHYAFHTGQIVQATKAMLDIDLSVYDEHGHRRDGRTSAVP